MRRTNWRGVFPVIVTPFTKEGDIDEAAFRLVIDRQIADGVHGIVAIGSTGEWFSLNEQEQIRLYSIAKEQVNGRVPLLVGTSAIGTQQAVTLTKAARKIDCDGAMVLPPSFAMPTDREILAHFASIASVGLPLMIYNNPKRTQINIRGAMAEQLAKIDTVFALKDSVADIFQMTETMSRIGDRLGYFIGLEQYAMTMIQRGADGIISVVSNIAAKNVVGYFNGSANGDIKDALRHQAVIDGLYDLIAVFGIGMYPFVKAAMNALGKNGGYPRQPYLPIDEARMPDLRQALAKIDLRPVVA